MLYSNKHQLLRKTFLMHKQKSNHPKSEYKVSCIVCAYNEESTIENIIRDINKNEHVDEIIVVDDASKDSTLDLLRRTKEEVDINLIGLPENKGKGNAMAVGIEHSNNDIITFVDADLINFRPEFIDTLVKPLLEGKADMMMGQPQHTIIPQPFNPLKPFTGERAVFRNDIINIVEEMKTERFGVETLINMYYLSNKKKIKSVILKGLQHPSKFAKDSFIKAVQDFTFEIGQIVKTLFKHRGMINNKDNK